MDPTSQMDLTIQESSVSDKIDADICPLCLDVFYTTQELLKHVLDTYYISTSNSSCSKSYEKSNCDTVCQLCPNSDFKDPSDLLKHFFDKHRVSSQPTCDVKNEINGNTSEINIKSEVIEPSEILETKVKAEDLNVKIEELLGPFQWEENNLAYNNVKIEEPSDETVPEHTIEPKNIKVSSEVLAKGEITKERKKTTKIPKCPFCSEEIPPTTKLRVHLRSKHRTDKEVPRCKVCEKIFATPHALEDHLNDKHGYEYECNLCPLSFNSKVGLQNHKSYGHRCEFFPFCLTIFKSVKRRSNHMLHHKFQCQNCYIIFPSKQDLNYHVCPSKLNCKCSFPSAFNFNTLKFIFEDKKEKEKASCERCDRIRWENSIQEVLTPELLVFQHLKTLNYSDKLVKRFCQIVKLSPQEKEKNVVSIQEVLQYYKSHENAIIRCEFCDEKFTSKIKLKHHVEIVHSKENDVGQNSKKRKQEKDGKDPYDDKSMKKVKFNL